jgi:Leucine-rich repeat (LRR) protein
VARRGEPRRHLPDSSRRRSPKPGSNLHLAKTQLDLSENRLAELPEQVGRLTALVSLNLRDDQLTELAASLRDLTALTWLDVSGNPLAGPPPDFPRWTPAVR